MNNAANPSAGLVVSQPHAAQEAASAGGIAPAERGLPMLTISGLVSVLDSTIDQIRDLIEIGELLWCFDLSLVPERAKKKELRVLSKCAEDFRAGRVCKLEWNDVARLVTPHDGQILTGVELQRSLNVSSSHLIALIRRKFLNCISPPRRGPGGSPRVTTASFLAFLKARRFY
jgi:hypothetical protein